MLAGQVKSGTGEAFVDKYLEDVSNNTREGVGLASYPEQLGEHLVTPRIVIAYVAPGSPPATVEDALTAILGNV